MVDLLLIELKRIMEDLWRVSEAGFIRAELYEGHLEVSFRAPYPAEEGKGEDEVLESIAIAENIALPVEAAPYLSLSHGDKDICIKGIRNVNDGITITMNVYSLQGKCEIVGYETKEVPIYACDGETPT